MGSSTKGPTGWTMTTRTVSMTWGNARPLRLTPSLCAGSRSRSALMSPIRGSCGRRPSSPISRRNNATRHPSARPVGVSGADANEPACPTVPPATSREPLPPSGRIRMPADWSQVLGCGLPRAGAFHQAFRSTDGPAPGDRVELVLDGVGASGTVRLNGFTLGSLPAGQASSRFAITTLLRRAMRWPWKIELPALISARPLPPHPAPEGRPGERMVEIRLEIYPARE